MKVEKKRIFISDLPVGATKDEIQKLFSEYGKVDSVEVKERKELGQKNKSLFFAYVNVEVDDRTLQKCFQDFANEKWHDEYVRLQVARESFLERLKREREENEQKSNNITNKINNFDNDTPKKTIVTLQNGNHSKESTTPSKIQTPANKKHKKYESSDSSSSEDSEVESKKEEPTEKLDIIIKNNKGKQINKNGLKIESIGKEPILKIEKNKKNNEVNTSEANLKRLQSLKNMKRGYQEQKSLIKAALLNVDSVKSNKIVFNDDEDEPPSSKKQKNNKQKLDVFGGDSEDEDFKRKFEVKEQFQGAQGGKLLQLQSRFKNDPRFKLTEKFLDENEPEPQLTEEDSLEAEKKREFEILEQIVGKKVAPSKFSNKQQDEKKETKKPMLRFDPSKPEHSGFELPVEKKEKKKKKKGEVDPEILEEKKRVETEEPEVSKDVFYKVNEDLKSKLHEKEEFSLLNMFGEVAQPQDKSEIDEETFSNEFNTQLSKVHDNDPFKYDSSDDEDEDIPHIGQSDKNAIVSKPKQIEHKSMGNRATLWSEPFFFSKDDYRLQEGFEFLERMKNEETEISQVRRDIRHAVRAKVRNNERQNRMFKKKLGGKGSKNARKKHIRIKKALKR